MTLTPEQQTQVNQAADSAANGQPFALQSNGANDGEMQSALQQALENAGVTVAPSKSPNDPSIVGTIGPDGFTANPNNPLQKQQIGSGSAVTNAVSNWAGANLANYGLVIFGALLALGALLISQRKNATTIIESVGKVAAVVA